MVDGIALKVQAPYQTVSCPKDVLKGELELRVSALFLWAACVIFLTKNLI
jgi:hypothetical protein